MPPKKKKEIDKDKRFQAIVLTDSFESRFMPLTAVKPRCLLPLANVPLIEYTLEFLSKCGVNEVYLMCSSHAGQIEEYVQNLRWNDVSSPFKITTIMSLESRSIGDSMRDLDNRGLITGDFLLISGDVVTNLDFSKAMAFHKHKKSQDKEHILTMVLTKASPYHRTRSPIDSAAFLLDRKTDRCLYYQSLPPLNFPQSSINLDPELLEDVEDEMILRNDLIDCHLDICSPLVPQLFQDNFDYQLLRSDFVKGVLTSDLVKKSVYAYLTDEYASRVTTFQTYDAVSKEIVSRWCYPLTPDNNFVPGNCYSYEFNHIYKEDKVILAQNCRIENCTCIGNRTEINDGLSVSKSTIGRNCVIGKNVTIVDSHIWDNVVIEDNCTITNSIIADEAIIKRDAAITSSVVGFNVVVGDGKTIVANTRLIEKPVQKQNDSFDDFSDSEDTKVQPEPLFNIKDVDLVGENGVGCLYVSDFEEDDDSYASSDDDDTSSINKMTSRMQHHFKNLNVSDDSIASLSNKKRRRNRRFSSNSAVSTDFERGFSDEDEDFHKEAVETVTRSIENNHDLDTAALELNTLKMSMNVDFPEVREAIIEALVNRIGHFVATATLNVKDATIKIFKAWGDLLKRQIYEPQDNVHTLNSLQALCLKTDSSYNQALLFWAIKTLYDEDVIEEEYILAWWNSSESQAPEVVGVRELTAKFVEWLQEAEEESEEE